MRLPKTIMIASCFAMMLASLSTHAVIIRHDKADSAYQHMAARFIPYIASLDRCTATVVSDYWLITAAHCVNPAERYPIKIEHLGNDYPVHKIIRHSGFTIAGEPDLALLQLRWPLKNAEPAVLYTESDELNKRIIIVGKGRTGNGITGDLEYDNIMRAATNTISSVEEEWLTFTFNQGDEASDLEGVSGSGDSGGPAFMLVNGIPHLAGVSCCQDSEKQGVYGAVEYYSRISSQFTWLQNKMAENPQPSLVKHPLLRLLRNGNHSELLALLYSDTSWTQSKTVTEELLIQAFITKNLELLKALIAVQPELLEIYLLDLPLLDYALKQGNGEFFSYLIDSGADAHALGFRQQNYLSRLMWQYFQDDANDLAAKLLQQGLDINQQDEHGSSALHMAGFYGSLERIKFLVENGANINIEDKDGETLLLEARRRGQIEIVEYLIAQGAEGSR